MKNRLKLLICTSLKINFEKVYEYYLLVFIMYMLANYFIGRSLATGDELSFYELYFWHMSNCQHLSIFHTIFFLIFIDRLITDNNYSIFYLIKYRSRKEIIITKTLTIFLASIFYVVLTVIVSLLECLRKDSLSGKWSDFSKSQLINLYNNYPELQMNKFFVPLFINLVLYFICIGCIYYTLSNIIKKKILPLFISISLNIVGYIIYLCRMDNLAKFTMVGNVSLGYSDKVQNTNVNIFYWLGILVVLLIIHIVTCNKLNMEIKD